MALDFQVFRGLLSFKEVREKRNSRDLESRFIDVEREERRNLTISVRIIGRTLMVK